MSFRKMFIPLALVVATFALAGCGRSQNKPGTATGHIQQGTQEMGQGAEQIATGIQAIAGDSATTAHVKARLAANQGLSSFDIHVSTKKGVVTLTGKVGSKSAKKLAAKVASETAGVRVVVNELTVKGG
ncbi:MAG: BON domain-containing protein [Gammaproteobacteria bacterium]